MSNARNKKLPPKEACREAALRLLERKPHTVFDLRRKLIKRGFDRKFVDPLLDDFREVGLLDDLALARDHCSARMNASPPVGRRRVLQELRRHGVDPETAERALEEIWDTPDRGDHLTRAEEAARRKLRLIRDDEDPRRKRDKLYRYLATRGFDPEIIKDAVQSVLP